MLFPMSLLVSGRTVEEPFSTRAVHQPFRGLDSRALWFRNFRFGFRFAAILIGSHGSVQSDALL